jgi:N-acetylmuramoyl-L-alanine amidase
MPMSLLRLMLTVLMLLQVASAPLWAAPSAGEALAQAKIHYQRLQDSPKKQLYRDNWQAVIDRFLALPRTFPGAPEGAAAMFQAGQAEQGRYRVSRLPADARRAAEYYLRIPAEYPDSSLADDALVLAAGIEADILKDFSAAWGHYRDAAERYPRGDQATTAKKRREALAGYAPLAPKPAPVPRALPDPAPAPAGETQLTGIRFWSNPDHTRVVLEVSSQVDYLAKLLPGNKATGDTPRLYLDLVGAAPGAGVVETTTVNDGLLQQVRTGRPDADRTRVVLDLVSLQEYKIFPLQDPFRIVIDVAGTGAPELKSNLPELTAASPSPAFASPPPRDGIAGVLATAPIDRPLKVHLPPVGSGSLRRIVVDPGDGGKDPGAIGPNGVQEKDVALALARELARQLERDLAGIV